MITRRADQGPAAGQGPAGGHGAVLGPVPQRDAVPRQRRRYRRTAGSGASRRRTVRDTRTPAAASCARACTTSCPVFWADPSYVGPAAIVNAHRFIVDTPRPGARGAAADHGRPRRRVALPDGLQLRGGLPARHPHHARHPRGHRRDLERGSWLTRRGDGRRLLIHTDGAARGNPGTGRRRRDPARRRRRVGGGRDRDASSASAPTTSRSGPPSSSRSRRRWPTARRHVDLRLDSELVARQITGRYRVKHPDLKPIHARVMAHARAPGRLHRRPRPARAEQGGGSALERGDRQPRG